MSKFVKNVLRSYNLLFRAVDTNFVDANTGSCLVKRRVTFVQPVRRLS